jgi:hypothetical protein
MSCESLRVRGRVCSRESVSEGGVRGCTTERLFKGASVLGWVLSRLCESSQRVRRLRVCEGL